jgi:TetR/AcrR family transcriptional regulator
MRKKDSKERILTAAANVFSECGFEGARVEEVASRARVNKAALYYHVGDKADLYEAVLMGPLTKAAEALESLLATGAPPEEKLRRVVSLLSDGVTLEPHLPRLILREVASGGGALPDPVVRTMARLFGVVRAILEEGRIRGVFRMVDPIQTHIALVGATMLYRAADGFRQRLAQLVGGSLPEGPVPSGGFQIADIVLRGILLENPRESEHHPISGGLR